MEELLGGGTALYHSCSQVVHLPFLFPSVSISFIRKLFAAPTASIHPSFDQSRVSQRGCRCLGWRIFLRIVVWRNPVARQNINHQTPLQNATPQPLSNNSAIDFFLYILFRCFCQKTLQFSFRAYIRGNLGLRRPAQGHFSL